MGVYYELVNHSKKELISFHRLPTVKANEIIGNPASSAMVTCYLMENSGDQIVFMGDDDQTSSGIPLNDISTYEDVSDRLLASLIEKEILVDCGLIFQDEDDPNLYLRDIRNGWMPPEMLVPKPSLQNNSHHITAKRADS